MEIERGKTLVIRLLAVSEVDEKGEQRVFFELNGQPRTVELANRRATRTVKAHPKADPANPNHVAAPMPGKVVQVNVEPGQAVDKGAALLTIEAMKMQVLLRAEVRVRWPPSPRPRARRSKHRICCWNCARSLRRTVP